MGKVKRRHFFLVILVLIIGVIIFIVFKNAETLGLKEAVEAGPGIVKPAYLQKPIPKIDKIKTVVDNPRFKEMKYIKEFFEPIELGPVGRANPFMRFRIEGEEEAQE